MCKQIHGLIIAWMLLVLGAMPAGAQLYDPVNDDTDLFMMNPNTTGVSPNILIIADNTANWSSVFAAEKAALAQVVGALTENVNVGLMLYTLTGGDVEPGFTAQDGGYPLYSLRPVGPNGQAATNRTVLTSIVNGFDGNTEKSNNTALSLAMYEAYAYFKGITSRSGRPQKRRDYKNSTTNPAGALNENAFASSAASVYTSPITNDCQKNYIIYISNGPANENASNLTAAKALLDTITPGMTQINVPVSGSKAMAEWADEYALAFNNLDLDGDASNGVRQNIRTYVIEVDPGSNSADQQMTAYMKSMANQGSGKYFAVSSGGGGSDILSALKAIFSEIQSVNSVFAAATLPISVNVRGTNLNQVYVGMFRPDPERDPRWFGNLKLYKLAFDDIKGIYLSDASTPAKDAVNTQSGFITQNAISFWTRPSTFWGYRPATENGVGGASDSPDGDLIEKGGVAQQLRTDYATDQSTRNVYTCTTGCAPGSLLSATPFVTTNTDINGGSLGLTSKVVDPLSALQTKSIATLTDRLSASLLNATGGTLSATLSNGATTLSVSSLSTADSQVITLLDARPSATGAIGTIQRVSGKWVFIPAVANSTLGVGTCLYFDNAGASLNKKVTSITGSGSYNWAGNIVTGYHFDGTALGLGNSEVFNSGSYWKLTSAGAGCPTGPTGTVATATVANMTYAVGDSVTVAGATPTAFNGTFTITSVNATAKTFTYGLLSSEGLASPAVSGGSITVTATSTTATAVTSTNHGFAVNDIVAIYGANPDPAKYYDASGTVPTCNTSTNDSYNGLFKVTAVPSATSFRFQVACRLAPNTASGVKATKRVTNHNIVTVTTSIAHGLIAGGQVIISGATPPEYNGTFTVASVGSATTFTYDAAEGKIGDARQPYANLPVNTSTSVTASANVTGPTVTVTATNHSLGSVGSSVNVIIESSVSGSAFAGTWSATITGADTLTYTIVCGGSCPSPSGTFTVRPVSGRAYVNLPAHGYATGNSVIISGANPTGYNGGFTITKIDNDNFTYAPVTVSGPNTAAAFASVESTTAIARSVGHGFVNGDSVTISGASPSEFNGTFTITKIDDNSFRYTISAPRGNATGTIRASVPSVSTAASDLLVNWVRGTDNFEDEDKDASAADVRSSIHGDVLHSQPTVVNYNRHGDDNDIYVFYGSNDGKIRAIKGGYASASGQINPGHEAWSFVAPEFFTKLPRQRVNFPAITSTSKRDYFVDGNFTSYVLDDNDDGVISSGMTSTDKAYLYATMRRGGRFIYAFDVTNPEAPKLLWKIDNATTGFGELGQTWSSVNVIDRINATNYPVAIFGAGYDAIIEDIPASSITAVTADTVSVGASTFPRTMGRGIYMVNAETGELIWRALGRSPGDASSAVTVIVPGMDCSIASDVAILSDLGGFVTNRAYVGDTCGNLWRVDFNDASISNWRVTKVAAIGNWSVAGDRRKFMYAPDVVTGDGYDAVLIGTGDREHPFDTTVNNRMYMFKDDGVGTVPVTGDASTRPALSPAGTNATVTESDLADVTTDCIQDETACTGGMTSDLALDALNSADGWYVRLESGEKIVSGALTIGGTVSFNTNLPTTTVSGTCSNLGEARVYQVDFRNASAVTNYDTSTAGLTKSDRYQTFENGGFLPSGVPFVLDVGDGVTKAGECIGVHCREREGVALQTRNRTYWYKEMD